MDNSQNTPFEVKNFNGGMTDFFLQAPSNFFQKADNFVLTNDAKLEVRYGSEIFLTADGSWQIDPDRQKRVDSFILFADKSIMLLHSSKSVFRNETNWQEILGPGNNPVFSHGEPYSFASYTQWNDHVFVTNTDYSFPAKIFKDDTDSWQVLTTGLPQVKGDVIYTEDQTLAQCILLANDLRSSMIQHFQDARSRQASGPVLSGTGLHSQQDLLALQFLQAVTPQPGDRLNVITPTPAPPATDLESLKTLVAALCKAQEAHVKDALLEITPTGMVHGWAMSYSIWGGGSVSIRGPNIAVSNTGTPEDLASCRTRLNDLRQKWYWHRLAIFTHGIYENSSPVTDYAYLNRYAVTAPEVPDPATDQNPILTPNYQHFISFVGSLKYVFNGHITNGWYLSYDRPVPAPTAFTSPYGTALFPHARNIQSNHRFEDPTFPTGQRMFVGLPDPTTLDEAILTLMWIRAIYARIHYPDSTWNTYTRASFDTTAGSASVTDVKNTSGSAITLPVGSAIFMDLNGTDQFSNLVYPPGERGAAYVVSSGSGTATLSKVARSSTNDAPFLYASGLNAPQFHLSYDRTTTPGLTNTTSSQATADELIGNGAAVGYSTNEWFQLAEEIFYAVENHISNSRLHYYAENLFTYSAFWPTNQGYGEFYIPKTGDYIYAFVFKNTYKNSNDIEFADFSNPIFVAATDFPVQYPVGALAEGLDTGIYGANDKYLQTVLYQYPTIISNIGALTNSPLTNYNLATTKVQIYRTIDAGNTFYLLAELDNGTTTYSDTTSDTLSGPDNGALIERETLYTTGGIVGNEPPPRAKYLHILNDTGYYASYYDGDQLFANRVLQSIPGSPGAVSMTFFDEFEESITGISSVKSNVIVFTETTVNRLVGGYNELGQGTLTHDRVSDNVGCISGASIVQTEAMLFFAGNDGFYATDGYNTQKISHQLDETYQSMTRVDAQKTRIQGVYDRLNRRVYWIAQPNETDTDPTILYSFELAFGIKDDGVFTTWSNGSSFRPSAITFFEGALWRGNSFGQIFYHSTDFKTDPNTDDQSIPPSLWSRLHIPYDYRSASLDYNTTYKGQWATRVHLMGKNVGNAGVEIRAIRENDYENAKALAPIVYDRNVLWGDPNATWDDDDCVWSYDGTVDFWRRMPSGRMRSQFRQIQIRPLYMAVYKSDDYPDGSLVTVDATLKTIEIQTPGTNTDIVWPLDVKGMNLKLGTDGYYFEYPIIAVSGNTITVDDPDDRLVSAINQEWEIWGYMKEQRLSITSYDIRFGYLGQRGHASEAGEGGGN